MGKNIDQLSLGKLMQYISQYTKAIWTNGFP